MIVKMCFCDFRGDQGKVIEYERMVECDTIHKNKGSGTLELGLYKNGKLIENPDFKDPVQIFIMENGKTIDRIDFKING